MTNSTSEREQRKKQLEVAVFPETGRIVPPVGAKFVVSEITPDVLDYHGGNCTVVTLSLLDSEAAGGEHPFGPCGYRYCDWPDGELRCNETRTTPSPSVREAAEEIAELFVDDPVCNPPSQQFIASLVGIISRHCSPVSAAPVFKNTKEAMEYAARHNMQSVIPVSAAGGDEDGDRQELQKLRQAIGWICDACDAAYIEDPNNELVLTHASK